MTPDVISRSKTTVLGIPILVEPVEDYLLSLRQSILQEYPRWKSKEKAVQDIDLLLSHKKSERRSLDGHELGWNKIGVSQIMDREWLESPYNEFQRIIEFIDPARNVSGSKRVIVCGAGLARIAAPIAELNSVESVVCTDLSWDMLYFGKCLARGMYSRLPTIFNRRRKVLAVSKAPKRLLEKTVTFSFCKPMKLSQLKKIEYGVADAFGLPPSLQGDLLIAPYLLDAFSGNGFETLAIRLCQQLAVSQSLLIVTVFVGDRDPNVLTRILQKMGVYLHEIKLGTDVPYSFSKAGYRFERTEWTTVLMKGTKIKRPNDKKIKIQIPFERSGLQALKRTHSKYLSVKTDQGIIKLSAIQRVYLSAAADSHDCYELGMKLQKMGLEKNETEKALSFLTSKKLIYLSVR